MVTALLVLAAVLVVLALVTVAAQMCGSSSMWAFHLCCGTLGNLFNVLGLIVAAVVSQNE